MIPTYSISRDSRPAEGFYASEVHSPCRLPVLTFLPTGYEPNYPYPLVVCFHGQGGDEQQVLRLAPRMSRRNYICIGLRGPEKLIDLDGSVGFGWNVDDGDDTFVEEYVFRAIEQARRTYHIHSERIFLAGFCEGASLAYRLGLNYPDKFGGVIALNGELPQGPYPRLFDARGLGVLIGHGLADAVVPLFSARRDFRLLYTAGLNVKLYTYLTNHRIHPAMLRDIDRWIIDAISDPIE